MRLQRKVESIFKMTLLMSIALKLTLLWIGVELIIYISENGLKQLIDLIWLGKGV